jgi:hypothetical protein
MPALKTAITVVEMVVGFAVAVLIGDFLSGKAGRLCLAIAMGVIILIAVLAFAIYAAIVLAKG